MINSCLIVASGDLELIGSEVQELSNLLSGAGLQVHVLSEFESKLELYRTLNRSPFNLVWIAAHSSERGFLLGSEILKPSELGSFLKEAKTSSLILNTCHSIAHIKSIQQNSRVDIVATIDPDGVQDSEAWNFSLYLGRALARTKDLSKAFSEASTMESQYRLFPAPESSRGSSAMTTGEEELRDKVENLVRILDGDPKLRYRGLIDTLDEVQKSLDKLTVTVREYIDDNRVWTRETEQRIKSMESSGHSSIRMTSSSALLFFIAWIVAVATVLWIASMLRG